MGDEHDATTTARSRPKRWFATGRSTMAVAAGWSVVDALLHIAIGMDEPARIGGNAAVIAAAIIVHLIEWPRLSCVVVALAAGLLVGLNAAFFENENDVLVPTLVFIGVALALSGWAIWRFFGQAAGEQESTRDSAVES